MVLAVALTETAQETEEEPAVAAEWEPQTEPLCAQQPSDA